MPKHKRALLLALFVFALVVPSVAAAPQGNDVEGVVTSTGSAAPIPGVLVTLSTGPTDPLSTRALQISARQAGINFVPSADQSEEIMFQLLTNAALSVGISPGSADLATALHNFREQTAKFKAVTGNDGRFAIRDVPPGQYTVRAERDGFFGLRNAAVTISIPGSRTPVALSLIPGATIGGRIRDDDGDFLPNATVQAFAMTYTNGYPTLSPAVTAKTDFRGQYRLFWMKAGDYIVAATRDGIADLGARTFYPGTPELKGATTVALKTGENVEGADFTISNARLAKISGEIINQLPRPDLSNAGLPQGIQLPADFAPPVELYVVPRDPNTPDTSSSPLVATVTLESNRGKFEFTAPPGTYDVYAQMFLGGAAQVPLDLGNQDFVGLTLNLQAPITVKGTINANGAAVDWTKVRLATSRDGKTPVSGGFLAPAAILSDGSFTSTVPLDGFYRANLVNLPQGIYVSDMRQNGASVFDTGFTASANTPPVEIVLGSGSGVLNGIVQDAAGKPLPNAVISIIPPEARRQNRSLYRTATSNGTGRFTIQGIIPGNYKVFAWQAIPNGSFFSPQFLARYEEKGKPITVEADGNSEVNLTLANESSQNP